MEREREGIVVDGCPSCRGLWLDRGELEKLIARAVRDLEESPPGRPSVPWRGDRVERADGYTRGEWPGHGEQRYERDDDDVRARRDPRRKRRWFESLGDVFD